MRQWWSSIHRDRWGGTESFRTIIIVMTTLTRQTPRKNRILPSSRTIKDFSDSSARRRLFQNYWQERNTYKQPECLLELERWWPATLPHARSNAEHFFTSLRPRLLNLTLYITTNHNRHLCLPQSTFLQDIRCHSIQNKSTTTIEWQNGVRQHSSKELEEKFTLSFTRTTGGSTQDDGWLYSRMKMSDERVTQDMSGVHSNA